MVAANHCEILRALVESDDRGLVADYLSKLAPGTNVFAAYAARWTTSMLDFLLLCETTHPHLCWNLPSSEAKL